MPEHKLGHERGHHDTSKQVETAARPQPSYHWGQGLKCHGQTTTRIAEGECQSALRGLGRNLGFAPRRGPITSRPFGSDAGGLHLPSRVARRRIMAGAHAAGLEISRHPSQARTPAPPRQLDCGPRQRPRRVVGAHCRRPGDVAVLGTAPPTWWDLDARENIGNTAHLPPHQPFASATEPARLLAGCSCRIVLADVGGPLDPTPLPIRTLPLPLC